MLILRLVTPLLFMAHAAIRIANGSIPQFGQFMKTQGFPFGAGWVWAITITELVCGTLILLGRFVRFATLPLLTITIGGIALIHVRLGWFVGEHGVGGMEYSVALIVMLLVLAASDCDRARMRCDRARDRQSDKNRRVFGELMYHTTD